MCVRVFFENKILQFMVLPWCCSKNFLVVNVSIDSIDQTKQIRRNGFCKGDTGRAELVFTKSVLSWRI